MLEPAVIVSLLGVTVATVGGAIALYNARKAVLWKRAELANSQLKELLSNQQLVFACRCLDWNGGLLVVPEDLRPLLADNVRTIEHDSAVFVKAMEANLYLSEMRTDPRLQIYRTAMDSLLGWLGATDSAINRGLYTSSDIEEAAYWLRALTRIPSMSGFVDAFGYRKPLDRLAHQFDVPLLPQIASHRGFGSSA